MRVGDKSFIPGWLPKKDDYKYIDIHDNFTHNLNSLNKKFHKKFVRVLITIERITLEWTTNLMKG